ncbi:uncharacterized protein LOC125237866 [Leguminivora glycinivorella]|uniref:uncharacterized protein LOC125237866 n=1 Tax=Leguminivora glycinivorella TaxID=1035111 RepID=UPI00200E67C0|nr:uncharacterized protein LOC125237866 [Leguminivora glycinivorella]
MFTFIFWTLLCYFHSIQGLLEPQVISATLLKGVSSDILGHNDSTSTEFAVIFNQYVNLTEAEKANREILRRVAAESYNSTGNESQNTTGSEEWQTALDEALTEENITVAYSQALNNKILKYLVTYASNPENLRELYHLYQERLDLKRRQMNVTNVANIEDNELYSNETDGAGFGKEANETGTEDGIPYWSAKDVPTRRIYHGLAVDIRDYPFLVSVHLLNVFTCAGSIIRDDLVLTAASCLQLAYNNRFYRENPSFIAVRAGSTFFFFGGETIPVLKVFFHPRYDPKTLYSNLAIMQLRRVLSFRHKRVKKIEIDRSPTALPENTPPIVILGWGATTESNLQQHRKQLSATNLDFYDHKLCTEIYGEKFLTKKNFCAGFITRGEGACNHDVGDPGVAGMYLIGVTSFGSPICGRPDTPTVFTKVGFYADWIEEIMTQKRNRFGARVTTARPYRVLDKEVILFGIHGEDEPIPLQREATNMPEEPKPAQDTASVDEHLRIVMDELKKLGVQSKESENILRNIQSGTTEKEEVTLPDNEQDPEVRPGAVDNPIIVHHYISDPEPETGIALREEDKEGKEEETKHMPEDIDYYATTMNPVDRATQVFDFEPRQAGSKEEENDGDLSRLTKPPDSHINMNSESDYSENTGVVDAGVASAADDDNDDDNPAGAVSKEPDIKHEENYSKSNSNNKRHPVVKKDKRKKTLRKKRRRPIVVNKKDIHKPKDEGYVPGIPPNILGSQHPIDLGSGKILANYHIRQAHLNDDNIQAQHPEVWKESVESTTKVQETVHTDSTNNISDDIVKQEIQKLLDQLEISSETDSPTEAVTDALRNNLQNQDLDKALDAETVLTFLYLTDVEQKVRPRAKAVEGLSIDPKPFNEMQDSNALVGKSEIYKIFADVMNTVVNKTLD